MNEQPNLPICPRCNDKMLFDGSIDVYNETFNKYRSECGMSFWPRFPDNDCGKNIISTLHTLDMQDANKYYTVEWCEHKEVIIEHGTRTIKFPPNTLPFTITVKDIQMLELFK